MSKDSKTSGDWTAKDMIELRIEMFEKRSEEAAEGTEDRVKSEK